MRHDWELAKELDINITVHVAMDRFGYTKGQLIALRDMDLLYPGTTYVHASHFTEEEWQLARDSGGTVSLAPQIEIQMGHGWAPAATAMEYGVPVGLSSDVATTASADQFTQMHAVFGSERGRKHQEAWDADLDGQEPRRACSRRAEALSWATLVARRSRASQTAPGRSPRQEGRCRHPRRVGGEHRADHRPGGRGRLHRGHLQRQDRARRR